MKQKRKLLGFILGLLVGFGISLKSSNANAFFGSVLSPEKLFEKFLKKAGGILMRYFGYRTVSNWENAWQKYQEYRSDNQDKLNAVTIDTQLKINQAIIDSLGVTESHNLYIESYSFTNSCFDSMIERSASESSVTSSAYINNSNSLLRKFIYDSSSKNIDAADISNQLKNSASKKISDGLTVQTSELHKIASELNINNFGVALEESILLYSDFLPFLLNGDMSKSKKVERMMLIQNLELIHHCITKLITIRLASINSSDLKASLSTNDFTNSIPDKMSELDLLRIEATETIGNSDYLEGLLDSPSFTSLVSETVKRQSINNKLRIQLNELDELIGLVRSMRSLKLV
ncbi:hypothetical protein G6355_11310 [Vibrio cholerae]|uniref:hypothetical protein n=1 Tax=Vibrio cholerae TaxID=666 RepID=UPI002F32ED54